MDDVEDDLTLVDLEGVVLETTEPIRQDLLALFDKEELVKYLAEEELYE